MIANFNLFNCIRVIVSIPKVEKVVYAPQKPTPKNNHSHSLIKFEKWSWVIKPSKKEPVMLIIHVPIGNGDTFWVPLFIKFPNMNLAAAPKEPPIPMAHITLHHHLFSLIMLICYLKIPITTLILYWSIHREILETQGVAPSS